MEDQGVQSSQTFLVTIGTLSSEFWIQITDLKQLPGLRKTNIVMYSIIS